MKDTILVAYATRYGSTADVAEAIGDELRKAGNEVEVRPISELRDLSQYRAAVIGSPIYMGKWLPEAQVFVERHQQYLRGIPVAYFAVGLVATGRTPDAIRKAEASMSQVRMLVNPVDIGIFPGRLESSRLSAADRAIIKLVRAKTGDFRDWGAVRAWAQALHPKIVRA
ncbi:MAG TPA: flavodoxin domain-containing protein [Candidatus Methanoculleus thermohydrogenotrophicum]|jgi:menaquinone-dependent protoporphyrinogen oxidase|nr:flavodoxin domain-containing protein [Candidatus Methanoculleus thermohydrogenotrophicum]NLM82699.1 flavodoxin [Candidatus Methanoculleus thermohydrogenotrophicum]HOB18949.1 flavodoxin domain-containing protein [Candidatus Methanoculleus thermohydrogenotrophicum]HPZ38993.1 flavodoxin domain-containing protein [Candidatus Methanoculleus thermohydrogenotrophicum]